MKHLEQHIRKGSACFASGTLRVEVEGCAAATAAKAAAKKNYIALTDYAKLDYKELQPRMKAKRIINEGREQKNNLLSSSFTKPCQRISCFIINHLNIEMRNLFCFYEVFYFSSDCILLLFD